MDAILAKRFERYVAIGDSSTEGIDDPDGNGGYRGWSVRLAERIARAQGSLLYAKLGLRGRTTRQIRDQQLEPALAMRPDLATLFSGTNDVVARRFDANSAARDVEFMQRALIERGATVLTFTLPDLTPIMPVARWIAPRILALNAALRGVAANTGAILVDFAAYPLGSDLRFWSGDRFHANAIGHARIADALAHAIGLAGSGDAWKQPLPPPPPITQWRRLTAETNWVLRYLLPWAARGLVPRWAEDSRKPPQPSLREIRAEP
jgi:lysophospholipase L1-like esterase